MLNGSLYAMVASLLLQYAKDSMLHIYFLDHDVYTRPYSDTELNLIKFVQILDYGFDRLGANSEVNLHCVMA
jgi:hypothetical protein